MDAPAVCFLTCWKCLQMPSQIQTSTKKSVIQTFRFALIRTTWRFAILCPRWTFTVAAGGRGCAVWSPRWRLTPAHAGGCSHAQEVDGVRLQSLQQILGAVLRYLHRDDCAVCSSPVGQPVRRQPAAAHLGGQRLPLHLDVCWAVAGETELWGSQRHCGEEEGGRTLWLT